MDFVTGCIKAILEKYAEPIVSKVSDFTKSEWEKFKIDSDIAFLKYLENAYNKYSKIKTILYRTEPKYIYNFFEFPNLEKDYYYKIDSSNVDNLLDISNFLIIKGTGGIGKSTFMKHLFINELEKKDYIPIFIELKDLNDLEIDYEISDLVFNKLNNLGSKIEKKYLEYAFKSGCFLFLLDGYDEIIAEKKKIFFKKITDFCDRYSDNYYIISSRPYSDFVEFQRFTVLSLCKFSKEQAISLINKIEYDTNIKTPFVKALEEKLYERHISFASNPLLLNIMLLTYDNYAEIPEKLHLFYSNAFETLYYKHDATKGGYKRELKSKLAFDSFKKVFACFCFITYYQGKFEFSFDDLSSTLKKVKLNNITLDIESIIYDLVNSICVLYKDGINYRFAHRSFQEYFTAIFLKELPDNNMSQMSIELIKKDPYRATHDGTFDMLFDMSEERVEQNIFLPILNELEMDCNIDKYDYFFIKSDPKFSFDDLKQEGKIDLWLRSDTGDHLVCFISKFIFKYRNKARKNSDYKKYQNELLEYLIEKENYEIGEEISGKDYINNKPIYELISKTWIGDQINTIANFSIELSKKKKEIELDLSGLLL